MLTSACVSTGVAECMVCMHACLYVWVYVCMYVGAAAASVACGLLACLPACLLACLLARLLACRQDKLDDYIAAGDLKWDEKDVPSSPE